MTIDFVIAVVLALLTIVLLVAWMTQDRRHLLYLVAGIAAAGVCLLLRFNDFGALSQDLAVLQTGLSDMSIAHIFGKGNHFCQTCHTIPAAMSAIGGDALPVQNAVALNRVLFLLNIVGFAMAAMAFTRNMFLSIFFAFGVAMTPIVEVGFDTNYPSAFLTFLFLVGALAGTLFSARERAGRLVTAIAVAAMVLATFLAYRTRAETASAGLAALAVMAFTGTGLKLPKLKRPSFSQILGAVFLMAVLQTLSMVLRHTPFPVWIIDGINPLAPSTAHAVSDVFMLLPMSMALLVFVGLWQMFKRPVYLLLAPVSILFLLKTATSASRFDLHTIFRMYSVVAPILLFAAMWGLRAFDEFLHSRVGDPRLRYLLLVLMIASFGIGTPFSRREMRAPISRGGVLESLEKDDSFLSLNPQLETKFLMQALDDHPDCTFRSRVIDLMAYARMNADRNDTRYVDIWFSRDGISYKPPAVEPSCLLHYRSLDCSVSGENECESLLQDVTPLREVSFHSRPYGNYLLVDYNDPLTIGLYAPLASAPPSVDGGDAVE